MQKIEEEKIYKCVVVGAGISGLSAAKSLIESRNVNRNEIMVLEAQDYIGGRICSNNIFLQEFNKNIELGAEIVHGKGHSVERLCQTIGSELSPFFKVSHGDGRSEEPVNGKTGMYLFKREKGVERMHFNSSDEDFVHVNEIMDSLSEIDPHQIKQDFSLLEYLKQNNVSERMIKLMEASFCNTMCNDAKELSVKVLAKWEKFWSEECEEDIDFKFDIGFCYSDLIDEISIGFKDQIILNHPVVKVFIDDNNLVQIETAQVTYRSQTVVFTCPPMLLETLIDYTDENKELEQKLNILPYLSVRSAMKIFLLYDSKQGVDLAQKYSGVCTAGCLLPEIWFEALDEDNVLVTCFLCAQFAENMLNQTNSRKELLDTCKKEVADLFPEFKGSFVKGFSQVWDPNYTPYVQGGYVTPKVGCHMDYAEILRKPIENKLFFAGEAYAEGAGTTTQAAYDSGRTASLAVIQALNAR
eukprot:augustus_masked-scaffold_51-processed-gene-1.72-mRNA-1 protein AED:1.00 eAED:1.00 QI:0/-1/0/0/-1/1/1/0/468